MGIARVGVTGPKGKLGSMLIKMFPEWEPITGNLLSLGVGIERYKAIVNCAAYTKVDKAETEVLEAFQSNTMGVRRLAEIYPGYLIHISTDFIFDGKNGPYTEYASPSPISVYGLTKAGGEMMLRERVGRTLIIRTTGLFDKGDKPDFVSAIVDMLKRGDGVELSGSHFTCSPTYTPSLCYAIDYCIQHGFTGTLHIVGKDVMTRLAWGKAIAKAGGFNPALISPAQRNRFPGQAPRPEKGGMTVSKALNYGVPISDSVRKVELMLRDKEE